MKRPLLVLALGLAGCTQAPPAPPRLFPLVNVWVTPVGAAIRPPLASDGARIFVSVEGKGVWALDSGTGAVVWRRPELQGRLAATPEALYVLEPGGGLWRLDGLNGRERWRVETGVGEGLAPLVLEDRIVVAGDGAAAFERLAGRGIWSAAGEGKVVDTPGVGSGLLLLPETDGALRCRDLATGESLWLGSPVPGPLSPPVLDERGRAYLGTGDRGFVSIDLRREGRVRWRWPLGARVLHRALVADDLVLVASLENVLYALGAGNGHMRWRQGLPTRPLSGPQLVGGVAVLATLEGDLLGYHARTGAGIGNLRLESEIAAPPITVGDRFVAALRTRAVTAVAITGPPPTPEPQP